jgi:hypothetical protein
MSEIASENVTLDLYFVIFENNFVRKKLSHFV